MKEESESERRARRVHTWPPASSPRRVSPQHTLKGRGERRGREKRVMREKSKKDENIVSGLIQLLFIIFAKKKEKERKREKRRKIFLNQN